MSAHRTRPGMLRARGIGVSDWPGHPRHAELARQLVEGVELGESDRELLERLLRPGLHLELFAVRYGRKGERRPRRPMPALFDGSGV